MIPRPWSALNSPGLSALVTKRTGTGWSEDLDRDLALLEPLADDPVFQSEWRAVKAANKQTLAAVIRRHTGVIVDPHTADGIKVALAHIDRDVPMICLETALPAKFPETIIEALGREPERPAAYAGLETRPQRFERLPADVEAVKSFIARHVS